MIRTTSVLFVVLFATLAMHGQLPAAQPASGTVQLTVRQLAALAASASTPEDHERLARYFEAKALEYRAEAQTHDAMLNVFQANPVMNNDKLRPGTISHCYYLARSLKQRAARAEALGRQHQRMAEEARNR
jgi:hypothetical protein